MEIRSLYKSYQVSDRTISVLHDLNLHLDDHAITVILGRSGCGKTTLLRLISDLEKPDRGEIEGCGNTGIIFQEPRLMPWLNVIDNVLFGLPKQERKQKGDHPKLRHLMELTGLMGFEKAFPAQLSGGMQQRTALARALAYEPEYLLMDEPFAALDHFTRKQMQEELLKIHREEKKGVLFVTHSIDEALTLAKKVIILENGTCKKEYVLDDDPYPRNLLDQTLVELKKDIIEQIGIDSYSDRFLSDHC